MTVVPFREGFDNCKAFLLDIAADETIEKVVIVTFHADGAATFAHCKVKRRDLAWASVVMAHNAVEAHLGDD